MTYSKAKSKKISLLLGENPTSEIQLSKLRTSVFKLNRGIVPREKIDFYIPEKPIEGAGQYDKELIESILLPIKGQYGEQEDWDLYGLVVLALLDVLDNAFLSSFERRENVDNYLMPFIDIRKANYIESCKRHNLEQSYFEIPQMADRKKRTILKFKDLFLLAFAILRAEGATIQNIKERLPSYMNAIMDENKVQRKLIGGKMGVDISLLEEFAIEILVDDIRHKKPLLRSMSAYFSTSLKKNGSYFSFNQVKSGKVNQYEIEDAIEILKIKYPRICQGKPLDILEKFKTNPESIFV